MFKIFFTNMPNTNALMLLQFALLWPIMPVLQHLGPKKKGFMLKKINKHAQAYPLMCCVSHGSAWATNKQTNTDVWGFICGLYQSVKFTGLHWYNTGGEATVQEMEWGTGTIEPMTKQVMWCMWQLNVWWCEWTWLGYLSRSRKWMEMNREW